MRALLAIHPGHLFDPPYPPVPVLLSYRGIYFAHIPAFQSPMNRIINRIFTEHSKIMDISCQGPLRKIAEGSDAVNQPFAVRLDEARVEVHRLTGGESLPFHREVFFENNLPR